MQTIKITTNNCPREVLFGYALTEEEAKEFDYMNWPAYEWNQEGHSSDGETAQFFRYKGAVYDLGEFVRIVERSKQVGFEHGVDEESPPISWDGILTESYFSGMLVKWADANCESVIVGRFSC